MHPPPRRLPCRGRISSEGAHEPARAGRSVVASGVARRRSRDDRDQTPRSRSRASSASASMCCTSRPREEMTYLADHKDVASVEVHAASSDAGRAGCLRAPRRLCADEPAGARRRPSRRHLVGAQRRASSTCSAPITRRTRARRRSKRISRDAFRHDRRADAGADHARPCQCRPADARSASSISPAPAPQRLFGISRKGRIAVGYDADFTVVDLKRPKPSPMNGSPRAPAGRPMTA